ncbi:hypothetical protein [Pseudoalteromonas rubra]|uniref:hypothetical protein n=1 Tax=Pseudoalteromonas rubra TaxID=43658 RepID=UPI0013DE49EA|nr:hypothetical protein [Pseudoalteromonas rubra]
MKFFIKRLKQQSDIERRESISIICMIDTQKVTGGSGGDGAQPRIQSFTIEASKLVVGG